MIGAGAIGTVIGAGAIGRAFGAGAGSEVVEPTTFAVAAFAPTALLAASFFETTTPAVVPAATAAVLAPTVATFLTLEVGAFFKPVFAAVFLAAVFLTAVFFTGAL